MQGYSYGIPLKKHKNIYFSISHSGKYVSVAADINNIGVDVEGYIDDFYVVKIVNVDRRNECVGQLIGQSFAVGVLFADRIQLFI